MENNIADKLDAMYTLCETPKEGAKEIRRLMKIIHIMQNNNIKIGDMINWEDPEPEFTGIYEVVRIYQDKAWIYSSEMGKEIEVGLDEIKDLIV